MLPGVPHGQGFVCLHHHFHVSDPIQPRSAAYLPVGHLARGGFADTPPFRTFYVTRAILSIRQLACGPKERNQAGGVTVFVPRLLDNKSGARYSTFSSWREKRTSVDTYVDDDGGNNSDVEDAKGHH